METHDELIVSCLCPNIEPTTRTHQNRVFMLVAIRALADNIKSLDYLFGDLKNEGLSLKMTLLAELGKFKNPDLIKQLAIWICASRMKTVPALNMLRDIKNLFLAKENMN